MNSLQLKAKEDIENRLRQLSDMHISGTQISDKDIIEFANLFYIRDKDYQIGPDVEMLAVARGIVQGMQMMRQIMSEKTVPQYRENLANRIKIFIDTYAAISPNWRVDEDVDKYTAPDIYELLLCAHLLEKGGKPVKCFSDWGSGGYKPYISKEGKEEHDYLVKEIYKIINS